MKYSKALEIMMQLKAEYFYAFKDMPDELFKVKVKNFMNALEDYSDKEIDVALGFVLKENKSVPATAHFIEVLERNRELLLPTAEEEWANIKECQDRISKIFKEYWDNNNISQKEYLNRCNVEYEKLSQDAKDYFVSFGGFLDSKNADKQDIEKNKFLKNFPIFRKEKRQREELLRKGGENNA